MEWSDTTVSTLKAAFMALIFAVPGSALRAQESPPWDEAAMQPDGISAEADGSADELIRDEQGRTAYNVRVDAEAASRYMKNFIPNGKYPDYQKGEIVNLIMAIERQYQFEIYSMTSWTVAGFSAYLTDEQVAELREDPRILEISPDRKVTLSADTTAVWKDSQLTPASPPNGLWSTRFYLPSTEVQSWGKRAVNQTTATSNGTSLVYVVDIGVGAHEDLADNIVERVNPILTNPSTGAIQYDCGSRSVPGLKACDSSEGKAMMPYLVGCYTHATAVAGIIGAKSNGKGTIGINPGVKIISVSFSEKLDATNSCTREPDSSVYASRVYRALDWVKADIATRPSPKLAVVNLSANINDSSNGIGQHLSSLAEPIASYRGAFVSQSAGNNFQNACNYVYRPTSSIDGIMVVGAINNHGQPVVPLNGSPGFWKNLYEGRDFITHEAGSNYGSCVEAWAPGDAILTTMGPIGSQRSDMSYSTYAFGSGTSFAAPHVAGLASYLIETGSLITPRQVEEKMRSDSINANLGSSQPATSAFPPTTSNFHNMRGGAINLPTLNPLGPGVARNTPYAEFVAASFCVWPKFVLAPSASSCPNWASRKLDYVANSLPFSLPFSGPYRVEPGMIPNNGSLAGSRAAPVWFAFDSYGTGNYSCDVTVSRPASTSVIRSGGQYYYVPATSYSQASDSYPPYMYSTACPSASVTIP
jgi:hypothetical protein